MSSTKSKTKPDAEDPEVRYKVDYSLDMIAHDLISNGQLAPARSYALKSPEIKANMGRQVKHLNSRRLSFDGNDTNNTVTFKPLSTPIGIVTNFPAGNKSKEKKTENNNNKARGHIPAQEKYNITNRSRNGNSKAPVMISHSKTVQLSTKHHLNDMKKSTKILKSIPASSNAQSKEAFSTKVDLKEFTNDEIALDVQSHTITITGYRPRMGANNSRKVTEVVQVPDHVIMDTLRIGRRADGALIIEENLER